MPNKAQQSFISFDFCDFHSSLTQDLLTTAIKFARKPADITELEEQIMQHTKKAYLTHDNET